jgi:hypothetical protein
MVVFACMGLFLCWGSGVAGGEEEAALRETLRVLNERIEQLEAEVRQLRAAQPPAAAAPPAAPPAAPAVPSVEARLQALEEGVSLLKGLEWSGMLYSSYTYNFNTPDSRENSRRVFDTRHNNFTFDLLQLSIAKTTPGGLGFKTVLDVGKTARGIAADWDGDGALSDAEESNDFEVQEAYLTYTLPLGRGVGLKAGKFVTLLGAEVIEAPANYNISRSFLFGFAIPFTHTGVLVSYPVSELLSVTAGVVNGWDNVVDANDGKTFLGSLGLTPWEGLSWTFNGVYGPEQAERGGAKRGVFDTVLSYTPWEHLEVVLNYDRGTERGLLADGQEALWQGVAGIVSVGGGFFRPEWVPFSLAVRGEWFADADNTRFGVEGLEGGLEVWEVTTTLKWQVSEYLQARLEYRHDEANKRAFAQQRFRRGEESFTRFLRGQDTLAAELAFVF